MAGPIGKLAVAAALAITGCTSAATGSPPPPPPTPATAAPASSGLPSGMSPAAAAPPPRQVSDPRHVTGTIHGPCYARGTPPQQLPDPRCTPGAYDPHITATILCNPAYTTGAYRPPAYQTARFKLEQAYPAYGLPAGTPSELDHLIALDLGGANDAANLWPEAGKIPNGKDSVENHLHTWVCAVSGTESQGRLESARQAIAADWITALQVLGVGGP